MVFRAGSSPVTRTKKSTFGCFFAFDKDAEPVSEVKLKLRICIYHKMEENKLAYSMFFYASLHL